MKAKGEVQRSFEFWGEGKGRGEEGNKGGNLGKEIVENGVHASRLERRN